MSDLVKADGFDKAIIGFTQVWNTECFVVVYDASVIIKELVQRDGMSHEEAVEFFEFNIQGAYVGKNTPMYMWPSDADGIEELAEYLDE
tara:strand:+ start:5234 stop:5500 length:267 start_codon:yes stop_codon:yes gene_type:complete